MAVAVMAAQPVPTHAGQGSADKPENTAETPIHFDIPAQDLARALSAFTAQSRVQVLYEGDVAKGLRSAPLKGAYTPEQALRALLSATPVQARSTGSRTVTLERKPTPVQPSSNAGDATLGKVTVSAKAAYDSADPYNEDYAVPNATTATKTDTPIMEIPMSVQVVPRAVIQDQKTPVIKDALENVSGVRPNQSLTPTDAAFIIRGFPNGNRVYRNGLGLISGFGGLNTAFDTANLESIEVLKGPASMLYGRIEPGGLINVTTKPPLAEPFYALEQQFGSYDYYRTLWDAGGSIMGDRSLLYRFSGAYQSNDSFRDFVSLDRVIVNPSLTWRPTEATELNINVEGLNQDFKADFGLPVIGKRPAPIPIARSLDDPNTPLAHDSHVFLNTALTHRFDESWTLRNRFLASWADNDSTFVNPTPAFGNALRADNRTLDRNIFFQESHAEAYTTNLDLLGKFQLWRTRHEVLMGFDYTRGTSKYGIRGDYNTPNPALAIDIFNPGPTYGIPRSLFDSTLATAVGIPAPMSFARTEWWGLYFQDRITLWDRLHILGGGRYDWAEQGRGRSVSYEAAEKALPATIRKDDRFSPRVGLLYQPLDWLSVYGNWANSLGANNGVSAMGQAQPPETAEQYEAGIKVEGFDRRLVGTLAFYHLVKQNILTPNLSTPDPQDSIAIGEARSRGIELDVSGQLTEDLSLIGSYAWTDARVTRDNSGLQGHRLSNVPEHAGSLWLKYDLKQFAWLDGLSFGAGTYVAGARQGDADNTFLLPGYVRLDAFAAYRWQIGPSRLIAQLNVRNLLDKRYYESTDPFSNVAPRLGVYPGAPLTILGSLRLEY